MKLPRDLEVRMETMTWHPVTIGQSDASTYQLVDESGMTTYLKSMKRGGGQSLQPEAQRLSWLQGKLLVPQLLDYREDEEHELLWMSEIPGRHAAERSWADEGQLAELVKALASGLRAVHSLPIADCPFDKRVAVRVQEAKRNVQKGWVDEEDFDEARQGITAEQLYERVLSSMPSTEELVFTHGDYCLPNVIIDADASCGFIDWGSAGVADRYQDIALAVRSLTYNFGAEWVALFLESYGVTDADWSKIAFYQLLDEFF